VGRGKRTLNFNGLLKENMTFDRSSRKLNSRRVFGTKMGKAGGFLNRQAAEGHFRAKGSGY